jgi:tRNA(Met) C34 N-acetyltransferase TmcA
VLFKRKTGLSPREYQLRFSRIASHPESQRDGIAERSLL